MVTLSNGTTGWKFRTETPESGRARLTTLAEATSLVIIKPLWGKTAKLMF